MNPDSCHPTMGTSSLRRRGVLAGIAGIGAAVLVDAPAHADTAAPTTVAPLPPGANGPAIPAKGYLVEEIRDDVYWVTDGTYQSLFLVTRTGVVAVDAPPSLEKHLPAAIGEVTTKPVTDVIYSHAHADHIGAAAALGGRPTITAHAETARIVNARRDPDRPAAHRVFRDQLQLRHGQHDIHLIYPGANHHPGNSIIHLPRQRIAMLVDVVFPGWVPFKNLAVSHDIPGYVAVHDDLLSLPFDTFVGGHLTRLGTREDVETARRYIHDVRRACTDALATVSFTDIAARTGFDNRWLLFDAYLDAVAREAAKRVVDTWAPILGGADIFTEDHCFVMAQSLRID